MIARLAFLLLLLTQAPALLSAADTIAAPDSPVKKVKLSEVRMRDAFMFVDEPSRSYMIISSSRKGVQAYTSRDLVTWEGPQILFSIPEGFWGGSKMRGIWAPELHAYKGKYYLFLTFDTAEPLCEQWREWLPRVKRGTQILVADTPFGPYKPFADRSTLPPDMMTLDGTLWVEAGIPYMVYCHEWVQIVNGTVEMIRLSDDLSTTIGEPKRLFFGSDGPWTTRSVQYGCWVTDAPWLHRSKSGKLFMTWSSGGPTGYAVGLAVSTSGTLEGPWIQQSEAIFKGDGGHAMLFRSFEGTLMMVLHSPNLTPLERARIFEMEDTGETLRVVKEITTP